jgi:hypothetical protein
VLHAHDWLATEGASTLAEAISDENETPLIVTLHASEAGRWAGWMNNPDVGPNVVLHREPERHAWHRSGDPVVYRSQAAAPAHDADAYVVHGHERTYDSLAAARNQVVIHLNPPPGGKGWQLLQWGGARNETR